jgi:hypothetical protein
MMERTKRGSSGLSHTRAPSGNRESVRRFGRVRNGSRTDDALMRVG